MEFRFAKLLESGDKILVKATGEIQTVAQTTVLERKNGNDKDMVLIVSTTDNVFDQKEVLKFDK